MAKKTKPAKKKKSAAAGSYSFSFRDIRVILILLTAAILFLSYEVFFGTNVIIRSEKYYIYIPPKTTAGELGDFLDNNHVIRNKLSFKLAASMLGLPEGRKGGLYEVRKGTGNYMLISSLKEQTPLPYTLVEVPKVRTRASMLQSIARELKLNKDTLRSVLRDSMLLDSMGKLDKESVYCIFIPGVYTLPANLTARDLVKALYAEFVHFFNDERMEKAEEAELSAKDVMILASIVYSETKNYQEMPAIAGVYINRLKNNMRLEADPTLVYASGKLNVKRVYKTKKLLYPAYNTYARKGLPPGPIHFPPPEVIDAVLDYEDHEYFYFCAKDSTGCHSFSSTYEEHKANADSFQKYLNSKKIF